MEGDNTHTKKIYNSDNYNAYDDDKKNQQY